MMLHIKFDQDWPTGFRDIQDQNCEIFVTQGQVTPNEWLDLAQNRTQPSFYACPGYRQLDDDLIKNERASMETPFSHYMSMGNF